MSRVAVLGLARQDIYLIDNGKLAGEGGFVLVPGQQYAVEQAGFCVGGGGANAAVALARYGHEVVFLGVLAHDLAGESVLATFDQENIDTSYISYARGATASRVALVPERAAECATVDYAGVARRTQQLSTADIATITPDWLYLAGLSGDLKTAEQFLRAASAAGAQILWRPGAEELAQPKRVVELLGLVDALVVNKRAASQLVPGVILTELLSRLKNYCPMVVITDGEMGAIATDGRQAYRLGIYEQCRVRDRLGAGDAFAGSLLAALAGGREFPEALQFASASASKVCEHYGCQTGLLAATAQLHPMPIVEIKDLSNWITKEDYAESK